MTYRNDHEAALARADALQDELARSERERARLASELARERAEAPRRRPVATPAIIMVLVGVLLFLGVAAGIVVALATR